MANQLNILILDPFHTGSHAHWSTSLQREWNAQSNVDVSLMTMPGRYWKWRMHGASVEFARQCDEFTQFPDAIICTDMLEVASFKGLLRSDWNGIPLVQYFHENQLTYPWSPSDPDAQNGRNRTYGFMNIISAMASDAIWFNSDFHRTCFINAVPKFLKPMPDGIRHFEEHAFFKKSAILPIGLDLPEYTDCTRPCNKPPTILWNHRWEFDKNPDYFLHVLRHFKEYDVQFSLILTGPQFDSKPSALIQIQHEFRAHILHQGFASTRQEYTALLKRSDFVIHSPKQEYFGISVLEAMAHGVIPLLGKGTAYEDWCDPIFLTTNIPCARQRFQSIALKPESYRYKAVEIARQFNWRDVLAHYDKEINNVIARSD
jgi:glycosyltransferase involved in cell wall biosynthesis